ncbi:uncharacterized protein LOC103511838 [Diaphorina citri]|uniref:Uncharacterized protein LOC103511838 n=1 Tax=Diaphorina citri TaxID=121845 RepID=A0A1S4EEN3_DIACI|nr:uncharacterized protein LOC103511838 [Diaphorina citri]
MNDEELEMLRKWRKDFDQRELTRNKPMYGGRNRMFRDIFSEDPPPSHPSQDTSSLTTSLSDLSLSGIDINILKYKDAIFESVTCWTDDSTDEEDNRSIDNSNRLFDDAINRSDEEQVEADTLRDLYVLSGMWCLCCSMSIS